MIKMYHNIHKIDSLQHQSWIGELKYDTDKFTANIEGQHAAWLSLH